MLDSSKKIPLVECFGPTIQGEGAVIGQQTYFLRFGLCDYRCTMCDSMHAVDPIQVKKNAQWLTQDDIFSRLLQQWEDGSTKWVTFSGGNPCMHDLSLLVANLKNYGWHIAVETQGTLHHGWLQHTDIITISPKGPGMGEKTDLEVLDDFIDDLGPSAHKANIKVVVFDARDLEFAKMLHERYNKVKGYGIPFYLSLGNPFPPGMDSTVSGPEHAHELLGRYVQLFEEQIKNDRTLSKMRFLPQWHVFVWGNAKGK